MVAPKQVIFWDIDGTLIESGGSGGNALLQTLSEDFGVASPSSVALHGRTDRGIFNDLLLTNQLETSRENIERLTEGYFRRLPNVLEERSGRVLPGVVQLLDSFAETLGCVQSIATGNFPLSAFFKLRHYGLEGYFDRGVFGHEGANRLQLARPLLNTARKLVTCSSPKYDLQSFVEQIPIHMQHQEPLPGEDGDSQAATTPSEDTSIVVIGDTQLDIALAKAVGGRSIGVGTGGVSLHDLRECGADLVLDTLEDTGQVFEFVMDCH